MNKAILITGVSGSGKTAIAEELKKQGYTAYSIEDMKGMFKTIQKKTGKIMDDADQSDLQDAIENDWICDVKKLKALMKKHKGLAFYCGTASNTEELIPLFSKVFLLKATEKTLRHRLTTRTNGFGKTKDVQDWVFSWKNWWEKEMVKRGAVKINSNRSLKVVADEILAKCKDK